jgi:hypothetical protein
MIRMANTPKHHGDGHRKQFPPNSARHFFPLIPSEFDTMVPLRFDSPGVQNNALKPASGKAFRRGNLSC